jgi:hypothetical protein
VPERFEKLGVIDVPVCIEGDPVVVCAVRDAVHDVVDLTGLMEQVADPLGTFVHPETLRCARGTDNRRARTAARGRSADRHRRDSALRVLRGDDCVI